MRAAGAGEDRGADAGGLAGVVAGLAAVLVRWPKCGAVLGLDAGLEMGLDDIMISDTIGPARPLHVEELLTYLQQRYPGQAFVMHVHDTRGMGLANCLKALEMGIHRFESSAGGLGGCPFAPGAAGNIATEDLVNMLHEMKLSTGIDADKLLEAVRLIAATVRFPLESHTAKTRQIQHNH